nr:hypothetical protein [Pedobacter panaciterrae]
MGNPNILKRELEQNCSSWDTLSVIFKFKENYLLALFEKGKKDFLLKLKGEMLLEIRSDSSKLRRRR